MRFKNGLQQSTSSLYALVRTKGEYFRQLIIFKAFCDDNIGTVLIPTGIHF